MDKIPISLGFLCESAIHRKYFYNISKENEYLTCPFDIMMSNYKGVIECIKNDFIDFCNPDYIELKKIYNKDNELWIYNKKYNFLFNHESPGHANIYIEENWPEGINHFVNNNFENFVMKYQKKINNFINYLNSGKHIIFMIYRYNNTLENLSELDNVIKTKYPNLSYEFDLLQDNDYERIYRYQLAMNIDDNNEYSEFKRLEDCRQMDYLYPDFNIDIFVFICFQ
jgi:hypothetical protein